jgi:hypothetical protein
MPHTRTQWGSSRWTQAKSGVRTWWGRQRSETGEASVTDSNFLPFTRLHVKHGPCPAYSHQSHLHLLSIPGSLKLSQGLLHTPPPQPRHSPHITNTVTNTVDRHTTNIPPTRNPRTMSEFLQIAQVLADLSSLQNTVRPPLDRTHSSPLPSSSQPASQDAIAAQNLLNANKTLSSSRTLRRKSKEAVLPEPPKFDKFGRRILRAPPALTRANSSFSSVNSSAVATPTGGSPEEVCFPCYQFQLVFSKKEGKKGQSEKGTRLIIANSMTSTSRAQRSYWSYTR